MDFLVIWYFEFISKLTYPLNNLEGVNVLLGQFLYYSNRGRNQVAFMKLEHSSISNFHKQRLVASVIMLFMINLGKSYCISSSGTSNVGIGRDSGQTQIQESFKREPVGDFVWCLLDHRGRGVIKQRLYTG